MTTFDEHRNLALGAVSAGSGVIGSTSGATLVAASDAEAAEFPAVPFFVTVWRDPTPQQPAVEIMRATAFDGARTFTVARAQQGTSAQAFITQGWKFANTITVADLVAIEDAVSGGEAGLAAETAARIAGDAATLSTAEGYADVHDATTLASAETYTDGQVSSEAAARTAGDAATLASAEAHSDAGDAVKVTGPGIAVDADLATFDGVTGKLIKDSGVKITTDGTLAANSDTLVPTEKAVKTAIANSGSLTALPGGKPTTGTYATNDIFVDVSGVAWWCTAGGTPGTWVLWGTGYMPGIVTNDSSGTDYGAVINTYMASMPQFTDAPKLPPGTIYVGTEVIPPRGVTLVGSRMLGNPLAARGSQLRGLTAAVTRVASCSNADTGFKNMAIDGRTASDPAAAATAFGVYAANCALEDFVVMGGLTTTFDSNASAIDLKLRHVKIQETGGVPTNALTAQGADWLAHDVYVVGNATFGGGGNNWSACHFVAPGSGSANPYIDNGGQSFTGVYFDTSPVGSTVMIDRTNADRQSQYTGCNFFSPTGGLGATSALFQETSTAGAGAVVTGAMVRAAASTVWGYFIKDPIASTSVVGVDSKYTFQTAFTNQAQPLGNFDGCMSGGVLASLGGSFPGSNKSTRQAIHLTGRGILSEPYPPVNSPSTPLAPATQTVYGVSVPLKRGDVVTGVLMRNSVAAAGTNPTTVRFGLADSTGKILVLSADRGTAGLNDAATVFAAGPNKVPFTGQYTVLADGDYIPCYVVNGVWGTTQPLPLMVAVNAGVMMAALSGKAPENFSWTGQTDLPAVNSSLTISSGSTRSYYLAVY